MLLFLPCNSSKYYCTKTHASKAKEPGTNDFLLPTKWYYGSICSGSSDWLNHLESQPLKITYMWILYQFTWLWSIYLITRNFESLYKTLQYYHAVFIWNKWCHMHILYLVLLQKFGYLSVPCWKITFLWS